MLIFVSLLVLLVAEPASDWTRFRGPNGSGLSDTQRLPTEFGPSHNVVWKAELPEGFSSPVIAGNRVFLTGFRDDLLLTFAVDRTSGKLLWERQVPRARKEKLDPRNHPAAASAATDGRGLDLLSVFVGE